MNESSSDAFGGSYDENTPTNDPISWCMRRVERHTSRSLQLLMGITTVIFLYVLLAVLPYSGLVNRANLFTTALEAYNKETSKQNHDEKLKTILLKAVEENTKREDTSDLPAYNYLLFVSMIIIVSVLTSLYRHEVKEIAKYEQYCVGFMRVVTAANNSKEGFETDVRKALTNDAFTIEQRNSILSKYKTTDADKKVESPLPGHPTSDLSAEIINKLLIELEKRLASANSNKPQ